MENGTLHYHHYSHPLGNFLIGATSQGLAFTGIGEHAPVYKDIIADYYPDIALAESEARTKKHWHAIKQMLDGAKTQVTLDINGTAFQRRVWEELRCVPYGQTISYSELAQRCGKEKAVRAVAGACGANPVCVAIPCHRILRKNGDLGGFACGITVKKKLLAHEAYILASRASRLSA